MGFSSGVLDLCGPARAIDMCYTRNFLNTQSSKKQRPHLLRCADSNFPQSWKGEGRNEPWTCKGMGVVNACCECVLWMHFLCAYTLCTCFCVHCAYVSCTHEKGFSSKPGRKDARGSVECGVHDLLVWQKALALELHGRTKSLVNDFSSKLIKKLQVHTNRAACPNFGDINVCLLKHLPTH